MLKTALVTLIVFMTTQVASAERLANLKYGRHRDQILDVYTPERAANAPIIVMLHGGAWAFGDKRNRQVWRAKAAHWGAGGYIFVSVNTRLLPDADPIDQGRGLALALAFVQANARRWGGDPERMIVIGHSAGAHVAALLAVRNDLRRMAGVRPWEGTILLDTAALDVAKLMTQKPARLYRDAFGADPAYWAAASPIEHFNAGDGPFLIVCSSKRRTTCPSARDFAGQGAKSGVATSILPVALRHSPINRELGEPSAYTNAVDDWIVRALK